MTNWPHFADVYAKLEAPLVPCASDIETFSCCLGASNRVLLLGVTPLLAGVGRELIAVDFSPPMLAEVWPGDTDCRRAVLANWAKLPFRHCHFDAVIGDGVLNSEADRLENVLDEVMRVLRKKGKLIFRAFCSPAKHESLEEIRSDVAGGWHGNVHALKWRIAMTLASSRSNSTVPVQEILAAFDVMFPDREALARQRGWSLDEIMTLDAYVEAKHSLAFPRLESVLALLNSRFKTVAVHSSNGYPLAERCPIISCAWPSDASA